MLYEFYSDQSSKYPGSINATYLLNGVPEVSREYRVNVHQQDEADTHMESSPYMSSSTPRQDEQEVAVPSKNVVLAKEEDLEGRISMPFWGYVILRVVSVVKAKFKQIHSIHIYSLGPSKVQVSQRNLALVVTMPTVIESSNSIRVQ